MVLTHCYSHVYNIEEEPEEREEDDIFLIFSTMSAIAVLIPEIPVLNGNEPPGWSVMGCIHS